MTFYHQMGNLFALSATHDSRVPPTRLPLGTYSLKSKMEMGLYLEQVDDIEITGKVYGDIGEKAGRIINTFFDRPNGTGVILQGDKGSGKTMLAKMLSMQLRDHDTITIIVNTPFHGEAFNTFMASIDQPAMIFFDEFEKVYAEPSHQQALLTLLDGVYPSKKLYVLTINDQYKVSDLLKNRPGRLYYSLTYTGLGERFIREYALDCLKPTLHGEIDKLVMFSGMFKSFNFDMLKAIIEEMNRYDEGVAKATRYLNTIPSGSGGTYYIQDLKSKTGLNVGWDSGVLAEIEAAVNVKYQTEQAEKKGVPISMISGSTKTRRQRRDTVGGSREDGLNEAANHGNNLIPISSQCTVPYYVLLEDGTVEDLDEGDEWNYVYFEPHDVKAMNATSVTYENEEFICTLKMRAEKSFNYMDMF